MVNEYRNTIALNTNQDTKFDSSDRSIKKSKTTLTELITDIVYFPPTSVVSCEVNSCCPKCGCGLIVLAKKLKEQYVIKFIFSLNGKDISITMFQNHIRDYFLFKGEDLPSNVDDIVEVILQDEKSNLIIDNKGFIISINEACLNSSFCQCFYFKTFSILCSVYVLLVKELYITVSFLDISRPP